MKGYGLKGLAHCLAVVSVIGLMLYGIPAVLADQSASVHLTLYKEAYQGAFYKVITDQIETYDPQTNRMKYLPMVNHAWTDGRGNYILSDADDGTLPVQNASEWRRLKIINRNDPNHRSLQ